MAIDKSKVVTGLTYNGVPLALPTPSGKITITENGTDIDVSQYATADVNVPAPAPVYVGAVDEGINFIDYDGTVVASWPSSEVAGKTALPDNPSHTGLVAQGWNWTLASIKEYIAGYPDASVWVGQMYKTASGLTEFDIAVNAVSGLTVTCNMVGSKSWGDGTTDSLTEHTYSSYGNYTITCDGSALPEGDTSTGGVFGSASSNVNRFWCTAVRIGEDVNLISSYSFFYCSGIKTVTMHNGLTVNAGAFEYCFSMETIVFPNSISQFGNLICQECRSLKTVSFPDTLTTLGSVCRNCYALKNVTIPKNVVSLSSTFNSVYGLASKLHFFSINSIAASTFNYIYCSGVYDFSQASAVPTLQNVNAFNGINANSVIKVPSELYSQWITATNWSTYKDYIVGV